MPGPWSRTVSSPPSSVTSTGCPGRAPLRRVVEQVRDRALEARRHADDGRRREVGLDRHVGVVARRAADRVLGQQVEPHLLERRLLLLAARELGQLRDQVGHLAELRDDVVEQLLALVRRAGRRPAIASTSMFVRRLVSGVRSSCEASWTSCRCRCCASSSDWSIALKVAASRLELVVAADLDALRQVARRTDVLGRLAQVAHRLQRRARDEEAGDRARSRPRRRATSSSQRRILASSWSTFVSGVATTIAKPAVAELRREQADVLAVEVCLGVEVAPLAGGDAARAWSTPGSSGWIGPYELAGPVDAAVRGRRAGTGCRTGRSGTWSTYCPGAISVEANCEARAADSPAAPAPGGSGRPAPRSSFWTMK